MTNEPSVNLQRAFLEHIRLTNPPDDRPEEGSSRWRDLRSAFMAGARAGVEAISDAAGLS